MEKSLRKIATFKNLTYFLLILAGIFTIYNCSSRERDNIFDPDNDGYAPLSFRISSDDSLINLSWNEPKEDYVGIKVFRKKTGETQFTLIDSLPYDTETYQDIVTDYDQEVSYYLVAVGKGVESVPTKSVTIIPGLGTIWVVDPYFAEIFKLK